MTVTDPTAAALIRAILTYPADDTPRLVYADYLDEHDQPERAEFIRVQIEIAKRAGVGLGVPDVSLWKRERQLFVTIRDRDRFSFPDPRPWAFYLHRHEDYTEGNWTARIDRGFVAKVRMPVAAFLDAAKGLFATHPIESVVLTNREPEGIGYDTFWRWFMAGEVVPPVAADPAILPDVLWRLFRDPPTPPHTTSGIRRGYVRSFDSRDEALAALSAACVAYGRQLAGLPG